MPYRDVCGKCGACRIDNQIGLEPTPDAYVQNMVGVFREVWRVLADDGTCWVNLGSTYLGGTPGSVGTVDKQLSNCSSSYSDATASMSWVNYTNRLKHKDMVPVPWMVAMALQYDGWYLRSDIIWSKPNPMPESVTDRLTKAHEYILLLTKSARYYYNAEAVKETSVDLESHKGRRKRHTNTILDHDTGYDGHRTRSGLMVLDGQTYPNRNKRSVWHVATQPYPGAHFATYPEDLIEPCILAGSKPGDTVLDPFNGSGTTGVVAIRHQRNYIGIDLSAAYLAMARKRISGVAPLFAEERVS